MSERVFITGGASGLGRALAEIYAKEGARVLIGDVHDKRMEETLAALGARGHAMRVDVTKEEDLQAAARWLDEQWGGVDVVVNNAGVALGGSIADVPLSDWEWIVDVNLLGVVRGCRTFAPMLQRQGGGHIVNVASMAGLVHPPMMGAYNATKAAVVALSETLRIELERDGIRVSVACPSFFRTNLMDTFRAPNGDVVRTTRRLVDHSRTGAPEVAALLHRGIRRGDFHIVTHAEGRRAWMLKRLAPSAVYFREMSRQTRRLMGRRRGGGADDA